MTDYSNAQIPRNDGFDDPWTDVSTQDHRILKSLAIAYGDAVSGEMARVGRLLMKPFMDNGVLYSIDYGHETRTLCVSAALFGKYDFSVRTEVDGDMDADVVVFSIRYKGELIRLDYDYLKTFGNHFTAFFNDLKNRLQPKKVELSYDALPYRNYTYARAFA